VKNNIILFVNGVLCIFAPAALLWHYVNESKLNESFSWFQFFFEGSTLIVLLLGLLVFGLAMTMGGLYGLYVGKDVWSSFTASQQQDETS